MQPVAPLGPSIDLDDFQNGMSCAECLDGAFRETGFTLDQVEKANAVEHVQLQKAQCEFLSGDDQ